MRPNACCGISVRRRTLNWSLINAGTFDYAGDGWGYFSAVLTAPSNVGYFCTRSARLGPIVTHSAVNAAGRKGTLKLIYFL
jgi:hypothetical protein